VLVVALGVEQQVSKATRASSTTGCQRRSPCRLVEWRVHLDIDAATCNGTMVGSGRTTVLKYSDEAAIRNFQVIQWKSSQLGLLPSIAPCSWHGGIRTWKSSQLGLMPSIAPCSWHGGIRTWKSSQLGLMPSIAPCRWHGGIRTGRRQTVASTFRNGHVGEFAFPQTVAVERCSPSWRLKFNKWVVIEMYPKKII